MLGVGVMSASRLPRWRAMAGAALDLDFARAKSSQAFGPNLAPNSGFDADISPWIDVTTKPSVWSAGRLRAVSDGSQGGSRLDIAVVPGRTYRVTVDAHPGTASCNIHVYNGATLSGASAIAFEADVFANKTITLTVTPTLSTIRVWLRSKGALDAYAEFDNFSVRLVNPTLDDLLTVTRASEGLAETSSGQWVSFPANTLRRTDKGVLVEEARTNSIRNNTMQGAAVGVPGAGGFWPTNWTAVLAGLTAEVKGTGTQNGVEYVDVRFFGQPSSAALTLSFDSLNSIAAASGQTWALSAFLAVVGGSLDNITSVAFSQSERDAGGVQQNVGESSPHAVSGALKRYEQVRAIVAATTAFVQPRLLLRFPVDVPIDVTLRIGLPQLELGAFTTSPIRTTGAAAVRAADNVTTPVGAWYNPSAGTLVTYVNEGHDASTSTRIPVALNDGTSDNRIEIWRTSAASLGYRIYRAAVVEYSQSTPVTGIARRKLAMTFTANDAIASTDGAIHSQDTAVVLPTVTRLVVGAGGAAPSFHFCGYVERIAYIPSRVPNATLQTLTAA